MATAIQAKASNGRMSDRVIAHSSNVDEGPGEFFWIDKQDLHVDPTYQRNATDNKVRNIAKSWSWLACGVLLVARRKRGGYFVMDGSHRTLAAMMKPEIERLPCMVFKTDDIKEEAQGFLDSNTNRKPVTAIDKFRALLITGDEATRAINDLIDEAGYSINNTVDGKVVKAVRRMATLYQSNPEAFRRIWPLIVQTCNGGPIHERVMASLFWIENKLHGNPDNPVRTLTRKPWSDRVVALGSSGVLEACGKASAYFREGGERIWGGGVVDALNHGVRNRLEV